MSKHIKYTKEILEAAVKDSYSIAAVITKLGLKQAGGTHSHIKKRILDYGIDNSHFSGSAWNKGRPSANRIKPEDILVLLPEGSHREKTYKLRRALLAVGVKHECKLCELLPTWNGMPLSLEIDHIDGNWLNNNIQNLRFVCPNCHSQQTETNKPNKHTGIAQRQRQRA